MYKKIISLCTVISLITILLVPSQAIAKSDKKDLEENVITAETIITEDNIYEVLNYLGIDSVNYEAYEVKNSSDVVTTVGEFENALGLLDTSPQSDTCNYNNEVSRISGDSEMTIMTTLTQMLYHTSNFDGFEIDYRVAGIHNYQYWVGVGGMDASINSPNIIFVRKIDEENMSAGVINSGQTIAMNAELEIGIYLGVGVGLVKIGSQTVTSYVTWGTSYIFQ